MKRFLWAVLWWVCFDALAIMAWRVGEWVNR